MMNITHLIPKNDLFVNYYFKSNKMENTTFAQECILREIAEKQIEQEDFQFYYEGTNYIDEE